MDGYEECRLPQGHGASDVSDLFLHCDHAVQSQMGFAVIPGRRLILPSNRSR